MAYNVKFLKGTSAQLEGITRDLNTFYYVDEKDLYLGNVKLSNGADLAAAIVRVADNEEAIKDLQEDIKALTGGETGSISGMVDAAVAAAKTELRKEISANTTAIEAEVTRATGIEAGLRTDVDGIKADYLKAADKTELANAISAEATTARAAEKANADAIAAVKEDVDAFFKDATMTEAAKDTLKEIQEYIDSDVQGAAAMTESINGVKNRVKAIEDDYLVEADKTELNDAIALKADKTTVEGINTRLTTAEGAINTKASSVDVQLIDARVEEIEGKLVDIPGTINEAIEAADDAALRIAAADATSKANTAESNAKTYTNEEIAKLENVYDKKGAAATAETNAKGHADTEIAKLANVYEAKGAEDRAKAYADGLAGNYATAAQGAKADTALQAADIATGSANGTIAVKGADVAVKGLGSAAYAATTAFDAAGSASTAEANAKAYVDGALTWGTIA